MEQLINSMKNKSLLSAYLYGSRSTGLHSNDSDYDILLVVDDGQDPKQVSRQISLELFPRNYDLELLAYSKSDLLNRIQTNYFFQSIKKEGKLIYGQPVF